MISPKCSFVTTVYNEEKTIEKFLDSLFFQTKKVDEIIIVDGESTDKTVSILKHQAARFKRKTIRFEIIIKKGNRSVGRNEAIKNATGNIILCSDAGNILDKKWVEYIVKPFSDPKVDVVAGYYKGRTRNSFQKCLVPYVLVMPDQVNPEKFLPATRSIAFKKSVWKKVGKFPEAFSHNEDYVFANKLKDSGAKIFFTKDAIVHWMPRNTWRETFVMFYRFALGDAESNIIRTNVLLLFARYLLGLYLILLSAMYKNYWSVLLVIMGLFIYILWSIKKNYRYIKKPYAVSILPRLQFLADSAVITGTISGMLKKVKQFDYVYYSKRNIFLLVIIFGYSLSMLVTLHSGAPNANHPFPYNMDEWHQLEAVKETFKKGTPNTAGSANGTLFHFLISGFYLAPFILVKYISIAQMKVFNLEMRERLFELLRLSTLFWGVLSIFVLAKIADLTNASKKITLFLFVCCPLWLSLSGFFKYDIDLLFWILVSLLSFIRFAKKPTNRNFILASVPSAIAFAVKVSAIPLLPIYILSFFFFHTKPLRNVHYLVIGIVNYFFISLLFGLPDMIFGKGNIGDYLINNILQTPQTTNNIKFGMNPWVYLFTHHYPIIFGQGLLLLFSVSTFFILYTVIKKGTSQYKVELFLILAFFVFIFSLLPLQILGGGNRSLVILPFLSLLSGIGIKQMYKDLSFKNILTFFLICTTAVQLYFSYAVIYLKISRSPQDIASEWMLKNIPDKSVIGIENIPIYQGIPDIVQKEFYFAQSGRGENNHFGYIVIDSKTPRLPSSIVMTNGEIDKKYAYKSPKIDLMARLEKEKYKKVITFSPNLKHYRISDLDYYYSWLIPSPYTTTVYIK
jgi:glycosyltransferase involved in cell wall biosynthesis